VGHLDNLHDVPTNITANGATDTSLRYYKQRNTSLAPSAVYNSASNKAEWDELERLKELHKIKHNTWATTGRRGMAPPKSANLKKLLEKLTEPREAKMPPAGTTILAAVIPLHYEMLNHFAVI
jgi:hypothetical protein